MCESRFTRVFYVGVLATLVLGASLSANHSWNDYHWARTTSSFTLTVVNHERMGFPRGRSGRGLVEVHEARHDAKSERLDGGS
jgi:hypothetical protein